MKIGVMIFLNTKKNKFSFFRTDAAFKLNKAHIAAPYNKIMNAAAVEP